MSVICWDGKTLAADRRAIKGSGRIGITRKIWKISGCLVGGAGHPDIIAEWVRWFSVGGHPDKFPESCRGTDYPEMIVINPGLEILTYERTPCPILWEQPQFAIGSGSHYAIAAMQLARSARESVEIACLFDSGCGNGVDVLTFDL